MDDWKMWVTVLALGVALSFAVYRYLQSKVDAKDALIVDLVVFDETSDVTEEQFQSVKKLKQQKSRSRKDKQ